RAVTTNTATKSSASPNAYMPLNTCASGPLVVTTRMATAANARRNAATYPPAITATLRAGFTCLGGLCSLRGDFDAIAIRVERHALVVPVSRPARAVQDGEAVRLEPF